MKRQKQVSMGDFAKLSPMSCALALNKSFLYSPHLDIINRGIVDLIVKDRYDMLLVCVPPRHGKSELISKWTPFWYLKKFPMNKVIIGSYSDGFASHFGSAVRELFEQYPNVIRKVGLKETTRAKSEWETAFYNGGMLTAGIGSGITGRGFNLGIIDDPFKNAEEANSRVIRERNWEWYQSTFLTRGEPNSKIIIVNTRWHDDDIQGRLEPMLAEQYGDRYKYIELPAIATHDEFFENGKPLRSAGEALFPERYPVEKLLRIKQTIGTYYWNALYQQRPSPSEGNLFKADYFKFCIRKIEGDDVYLGVGDKYYNLNKCERFQVVDLNITAKQDSDFMVIQDWAVTPDKHLIFCGQYRGRPEAYQHAQIVKERFQTFRPSIIGIESTGYQASLSQQLSRDGLPIIAMKPETDKQSRVLPAIAAMEFGRMMFEKSVTFHDLFDECLYFPHGKHDDQVDCIAYAHFIFDKYYSSRNLEFKFLD